MAGYKLFNILIVFSLLTKCLVTSAPILNNNFNIDAIDKPLDEKGIVN